jgi:hypothetical protein
MYTMPRGVLSGTPYLTLKLPDTVYLRVQSKLPLFRVDEVGKVISDIFDKEKISSWRVDQLLRERYGLKLSIEKLIDIGYGRLEYRSGEYHVAITVYDSTSQLFKLLDNISTLMREFELSGREYADLARSVLEKIAQYINDIVPGPIDVVVATE